MMSMWKELILNNVQKIEMNMKHYKYLQIALLTLMLFSWVGCSQIEEEFQENSKGITLNVADAGVINNESSTRTQDAGFVTTFTQGDQIGLFAVKEGVILNEINNLPFTFNGSSWSGKPILYDARLEGVTFYAYYPYQADMTDKIDLAGDDFFAPLVDKWELTTNQSDQKEYAKQDLMTSNATPLVGVNGNYSLDFQLTHRMSLVVVQLPSTRYIFTDAEGVAMPEESPYIAKPVGVAFYLDNVGDDNKVSPYYDEKNDEYRILRKPATDNQIIGHYNGKQRVLDTAGKMIPGRYKRFIVDGGYKEVNHHLQVGDLYYADGSVVSVNEENPSSKNCIGVVYYVGNPQPSFLYPTAITDSKDVLKREHPNCIHGLVLNIGPNESDIWGDGGTGKYIREWYDNWAENSSFITMDGYYYQENGKRVNLERILGYNNTRVINEFSKQTLDFSCKALDKLAICQANYQPPMITSNWYLPSACDMSVMWDNLNKLNGSLNKVGENNQLQLNELYWTSNERNKDLMYYAQFTSSKVNVGSASSNSKKVSNKMFHRFVLAF